MDNTPAGRSNPPLAEILMALPQGSGHGADPLRPIMPPQVSIALVGCGIGGIRILHDLLHLETEVIVVDAAEEHRLEAIKQGAAEAVSTLSDLPKVKGIIIGALPRRHEEIVEEALARGVPVLTEKPFTIDPEASERLARIAPERLFVMHTLRYHAGIAELASIAARKEFGEVEWLRITRTSWTHHRNDPDAAWGLIAQDLSIVLEILREIPPPVSATPEVHDGIVRGMLAVLGGTPRVVVEDSTRYSDNRREVRLHCADGIVVLPDMTSGYIEITPSARPGDRGVPDPDRRPYAPEQPRLRELKDFLAHAESRRHRKQRGAVAEGLAVVRATDRIRRLAGY